jgi:hypothetical protein
MKCSFTSTAGPNWKSGADCLGATSVRQNPQEGITLKTKAARTIAWQLSVI